MEHSVNLLSIGGSDPSTGAGIQSDIKLFANMDVNCFTIITAINQNSKKSARLYSF